MRTILGLLLILVCAVPAAGRSLTGSERWSGRQVIDGSLRVEPGAELVVAPGTRVIVRGGRLEVAGRLVAREAVFTGESWEGIVLKGCDAETRLAGCRIEQARTGLLAVGGAPRMEGLTLTGNDIGMELRRKSEAVVTGSRFVANRKVGLFVKDDAAPVITGNFFSDNGRFGAYIFRALPARFADNRFVGNATGLMVASFGSDPEITGNHFADNGTGIHVDRAARPRLTGNLLTGNETGVRLYRRSDPLLEGNRLADNETGISVAYSSYPTIRGNDLAGNGTALRLEFQSAAWERQRGAAVRASETAARGAFGQAARTPVGDGQRRPGNLDGTVDARDNWWGKSGTAELERLGTAGNPSFIHDGRDQPLFEEDGAEYPLDRVRFAPWRRSPATEMP